MPYSVNPKNKKYYMPSFHKFWQGSKKVLSNAPSLESRGNRDFRMNFEEQLKILVFFHLEEHKSARHLMQVLKEEDFARDVIAPSDGIEKSSFSEAINERGLEQMMHVFQGLQSEAHKILPKEHPELGELVAIDGSLIDTVLSMHWAGYRKNSKKAKVHVGFDINRYIPSKIFLTDGKGAERPFVSKLLSPGQTGVLDRGYQCHKKFDFWQTEKTMFVCRIKANTTKKVIKENTIKSDGVIFYDSIVLLGTPGINQTEQTVRLVGYSIKGKKYRVATNRYDLTAEQVGMIYKLRWEIEKFFAWWKRHLKVYHLIARSEHGLMIQILAGLITYLLLAIYCRENYNEKVSIKRVRELRTQIQNEARSFDNNFSNLQNKEKQYEILYAKT